ncbi:MAG: hypothetical protein SOZ22_00195 [Ezakiella sp.]|nr:hypothetical protein [Ezakiella sp.]
MYRILITSRGMTYEPIVKDNFTIKRSMNFEPSTLTFELLKDELINYQEGANVKVYDESNMIYSGFIVTKSRDKNQIIKNVCYDSMWYFKNKDTLKFEDMTYSEIIEEVCSHQGMITGEIEDTGYKIKGTIHRNKEYFTIFKDAYDMTLAHNGEIFTLFDENGRINLKKPTSMMVEMAITFDNACNFSYKTSIENSYNRIKLSHNDDEKKELKYHIKEDMNHIKEWGLRQYMVESSKSEDMEAKAARLLELLNRKERTLEIKDCIGNWEVRGGSLIPVVLGAVGDIAVNSMMFVSSVVHKVKGGVHLMDVKVYNKDIMPLGGK